MPCAERERHWSVAPSASRLSWWRSTRCACGWASSAQAWPSCSDRSFRSSGGWPRCAVNISWSGRAEEMPKVSVVLTAYNREAMIGAAIDSLLAQTFDDFEIVVVDDGSAD